MSGVLYRWGRWAASRPWRVLVVWLLVVLGVVVLLATRTPAISTALTLPDAPAQQVLDEIEATLPEAGGTQGFVVFTAVDGGRVDEPARADAIGAAMDSAAASGIVLDKEAALAGQRSELEARVRAQVRDHMASSDQAVPDPAAAAAAAERAVADGVDAAMGRLAGLTAGTAPQGSALVTGDGPRPAVLVSDDGTTAVATVQLTAQASDLPDGSLERLLADVDDAVAPSGLVASASSALQPLEPPVGGTEGIGLAVAAVVLLAALGSLVLAGLPILIALLGVLIGVGGAYSLSASFEMTTSTPALGLMLGLAVGIDYALFLVHKQRSLRARLGLDPLEATARATATAGSAVLFAGVTVVIALLGLITLGMGFVTTMAVTAAVTVVLAVALSLTALPALLGLVGARARVPRRDPAGHAASGHAAGHGRFGRATERWVGTVTSRPGATIVLVVLGLGALAAPAFSMHLGMPSGAVADPGAATRIAYDGVTRTLGEGANAPLVVALTPEPGTQVDLDVLERWQGRLADREGVANVQLMGSSTDAGLVLFTVVPDSGPTDQDTADLVADLRAGGVEHVDRVGVTGLTALNIDLSEALAAAIPVYLALVVGLSLVVLLVVLRSVVVPLAATAGFLLSIGATMGLVVTAFGDERFTWLVGVDRAGPVLSFLPIMATGILYGLAMDYQVFLGTSVRESHVHGATAHRAIVDGVHHAGRVVVAAAVIMVSVFGGFVLSDDATIRQFGFALAAGVLIDAFLVRMTLIPAVLQLAGNGAWWLPRRLVRLLPELDVEGSRLDGSGGAAATPAEVEALAAGSRGS